VRRTLQQSVRLVHQLLTLSAAQAHPQTATRGPVESLDTVVRQVVEDLAGRAQARDIDLGFEMLAAAAPVHGHAVMLREIAMNLVDNAIRYVHFGGIVTCRIEGGGERVMLVVEDNGPGIPRESRERVFERFYRLRDDDSDGCGLGLSIVEEFANRLGAHVSIETPPTGQGVAIRVVFPRVADAAAAA
jgi:two-component system sensor histidine kinase TctE